MTKFYQEDIVHSIGDPTKYGVVLRCWHDPDDIPPQVSFEDPLLRALQPGEVGVSFFPTGHREILPESHFELVDRTLQVGDVCKRNLDDLRSGIVIRADVKARLEHAISGEPLDEWVDAADIKPAMDVQIGDYVVYDEWVGQVIELFDEALIQLATGQLVRIPELSARLTVGDKGNDIIPHSESGMPGFFGFFQPPSNLDTVVSLKHTVLAISWLAINQTLDLHETESRQRPRRIWYGEDLNNLTLVRNRSDTWRVGEKVLLKDDNDVPFTTHGSEDDPNGVVEVRHFVVRKTRTVVTVLWQDNVQESVHSTELIPYLNPDEYDCWPGDPVVWKGGNQVRPAIVQSVNSIERTAHIRYMDTLGSEADNELTSLLELDPHGTHNSSTNIQSPDDLGVHRGDSVFIHRPGTTNCAPRLRVPRIGELEAWVREVPIHINGQLGGWRREMSDIGAAISSARLKGHIRDGSVQSPQVGDASFNWFGEVTNLGMDGSVEVTLPDASVMALPLERLSRLHDGLEQLEDFWGDELSEDHDHASMEGVEGLGVWETNNDVYWHTNDLTDANDWEDEELVSSMDIDEERSAWDADNPGQLPLPPPVSLDGVSSESAPHTQIEPVSPPRNSDPALPDKAAQSGTGGNPEASNWKRFEILSSAPADHAFRETIPVQPSRAFLGRLTKEYRALSNSLPDSIIVRAYEDRTDLLRSLIMGPENTPYEDAPFVIDWKLESDFPITPPTAHFMSWTNGNGRVNPNLYEDGKVCLSILGTWAGDRNETWSASRSSLLQAFVSIQGLVLVKEPYFCEPAYEKFRQTVEGTVNSRLYNEKAYVLARGFILRALELRLEGLQSELDWMYFSNGTLNKVLDDAEALIERSHTPLQDDRDLAVPKLTTGGIISLRRVLGKLRSIRSSTSVYVPSGTLM